MVGRLKDGFKTLNNPWTTAVVLLISAAVWFVQGYMVYLCLESIGLRAEHGLRFGLNHALFILMVINMAIMAPAAPGNIGTFEFSAMLALGYLGVDKAPALSFALIYHFVQVIPLTIAGILALPILGIKLGDIRRGDADVEKGDRRDDDAVTTSPIEASSSSWRSSSSGLEKPCHSSCSGMPLPRIFHASPVPWAVSQPGRPWAAAG